MIQTEGLSIDDLNKWGTGNMIGLLGIEFVEVTQEYIKARMPVDSRTVQTFGYLHGGASVSLAETIGSIGANFSVDREKFHCVGLEINANHIRVVKEGWVYATARPLNVGRKFQVWEIKIENKEGKLVCVCRLTMAVMEGKAGF